MNMEQPNNDIESIQRETYEKYRKEIETFNNLPDSTFSDMRGGDGAILDLGRAKSEYAHGILKKIENDVHSAGLTSEQQIELQHLWEKEIMGFTKRRTMHDAAGKEM